MAQNYSYRKVKDSWVVVHIKTQAFVKWFRDEKHAILWTITLNDGIQGRKK